MRYSKAALLLFGLGLLLGLVVLIAEMRWLARVASGTMALGLVVLPIAIVADLRRRRAPPTATPRPRSGRRPARRPRARRASGSRR